MNVRLGDICDFLNGGTSSKSIPSYFEGHIPWITGANISSSVVRSARSFITEEAIANSATNRVPAGTVLLVTRTSVGKVAIAGMELCFSQDITALKPDADKLDISYLVQFLRTQESHFERHSRGATIKGITRNVIESLEIPLPPIAEQKRIAAILDKAEELRGLRRKALEELDAIVQSIFLEMFGDPGTNLKGWNKGCLGEIATFVGGGTPRRERPEYFKGSICWATSKDMKYEFLDDTQEHITPQAIEESATNLIPVGTILIVVKSKVLMHSLPVSITRVPTCFGQDVKGIKVTESCSVTFVATALRYGKRWLLERARGINTEGLTLDHLRAFPLILLPINLQQEFARRVEAIEQLKAVHRESLAQLDALFASLQHRAFRGEL